MTVVDDPRLSAEDMVAAKAEQPAGKVLRSDVLADLARDVAKPDVTFEVRTRPGWSVRYSTVLDADLVAMWTRECTGPDGVDQFRLALVTLAGLCRGLIRKGEDLGITFAHPELLATYGALQVPECVRAFYADDTLVSATYASLLEQTGLGERLDPTTGSSV